MTITTELFEAFLKCPTKFWLRFRGQADTGNDYAQWTRAQNEAYRANGVKGMLRQVPEAESLIAPSNNEELRGDRWRVAVNVVARVGLLESSVQAVERIVQKGNSNRLVPVRWLYPNKLTREDKLLLAFDSLALSEMTGAAVTSAKLIHGDDHKTLKLNAAALAGKVRVLTAQAATLLAKDSPPDLVLNRHCAECEFKNRCRQQAVERDDLSLLAAMTEKERRKLRSKGIFTVTQLSYTFRPRRRPKTMRARREKYHHSLKALAIREKKIHVLGSPQFAISGTPVYLDVEGVPDRDFYYLIGVRVGGGEGAIQHSLWAERKQDEGRIWAEFLGILAAIKNPTLVHYGSFDSEFLKRMSVRYRGPPTGSLTEQAIRSPVNVVTFCFGQVYFPTFSNSLKEIAGGLGVRWGDTPLAGLDTIVWRCQWEAHRDSTLKERLVTYNANDCFALEVLSRELSNLDPSRIDVDFTENAKRPATECGMEIHRAFDGLLKSAHSDYVQKRIRLNIEPSSEGTFAPIGLKAPRAKAKPRRWPPGKGRIVRVTPKRRCPVHHGRVLKLSRTVVEDKIIDIVFTSTGCRKTLVRYLGRRAYCSLCHKSYLPPAFVRMQNQTYGTGLCAMVIYQRIVLRLSVRLIAKSMFDVHQEIILLPTIAQILKRAYIGHARTESRLLSQILHSPSIHVDETTISILGTNQYIWVITNGSHVVFRLTESRETDFLKELLHDYKGVVVSDFYGGYDALPCRQQKCLVHLIRDLNDDLWKSPFDPKYEAFVATVRDLILPIIQDVRRFGLKTRNLRKHKARVERFYRDTVERLHDHELLVKYQKRFERYRESMFCFLESNGVSWHNNTAERALRHVAVQRKISGAFSTKGAEHYIRMLGIAQTCRFQKKSFLGFLLSGLNDIDAYKDKHRYVDPNFD